MTEERHVWLTPQEVSVLADKHPVTVYKALKAERLHGHRHPWLGRWMVHVSSAEAYGHLEANTRADCDCKDSHGRNAAIQANDDAHRHAPRRSRGPRFHADAALHSGHATT